MSFCFLYNVVSEKHSVQNSTSGEGDLLPAQGLLILNKYNIMKVMQKIKFMQEFSSAINVECLHSSLPRKPNN